MSNDKLGFTFYPKDWWTSESFFELNKDQRYIYLESLFVMYSNNGYMKTQKTQLENRLRIEISDSDWKIVTDKFISDNNGFTHQSVNKRLRKTLANRENGKKGGRPPEGKTKPKEPNKITQNNPPSERERERESEEKYNKRFSKELLSSESWLETIAMQHKIKPDEIPKWIEAFELKLENELDVKISKKDFASHFTRWLPGELKKKQTEKPEESRAYRKWL